MSAKVTRGDFSGTASILVDSPFFRNVLLLTLIFDSTCSLDEPRLSLFKSTKFVLDLERWWEMQVLMMMMESASVCRALEKRVTPSKA